MIKKSKSIKKVLALILCSTFIVTTLTACGGNKKKEDPKTSKKVEEKASTGDIKVKEDNNKVYIALKGAFTSIGADYSSKDKNAEIKNDKEVLKITEGSKEAVIDSVKISMPDEIKTIEGELYASLESLKEIIDGRVSYDKESKKVHIKSEMKVEYSKGFSIKYLKGGVKKVTDGDKRTLILLPKEKEVPENYKNETVIKTPVKNVFTASSTQTCFLRPLDELTSLTAVTLDADRWTIEEVKKGIENKKISYVGRGDKPDYEKIKSLNPEITFTYSGPSGQVDLMKKLDELKMPYAVDNEYMEEDPLGRMEWIKFMAAFYDKEELAEKVFNDTVAKVNKIKEETAKGEKPKILWGSISKGDVYVPKAGSYAAKMIEIAGGEYVFKDMGQGSGKISLEEFYSKGKEADIFMYSMSKDWAPSIESIVKKAPTLGKLKTVSEKNVWHFHKDYYQSIDKTGEIIEDLYYLIHPEKNKDAKIRHFEKYEK